MLTGPIAAGLWKFVGGGAILQSCDVQFNFVWRRSGVADQSIVSFAQHFDPPPSPHPFAPVPYSFTGAGAPVPSQAGDQLVLQLTVTNSPPLQAAFIFDGDGPRSGAPLPYLMLP